MKEITTFGITPVGKKSVIGKPSGAISPFGKTFFQKKSYWFLRGYWAGEGFAGLCASPNIRIKGFGKEQVITPMIEAVPIPEPLASLFEQFIMQILTVPMAQRRDFLTGFASGMKAHFAEPRLKKIEQVHKVLLKHWPPQKPIKSKAALIKWLRGIDPEVFDREYDERSFRRELERKKVMPKR